MKKQLVVIAVATLMAGAANATIFGGNTENNYDNRNYGGNGGAGGAGGNATGIGVGVGISGSSSNATGGAVVGSGNSTATGGSVRDSGNSNNHNANVNANVNRQGQGQDQSQSSRNSNRNANNNSNVSSAQNSNSNANSGNNSNTEVNVEGSTYHAARIPVATAYAPNNVPTATCMGSSSAGVQSPGFGVSLGSSWTDTNCVLLEQIRTVAQVLGQQAVAQEMMKAIPAYADAVARLNPAAKKSVAAVPASDVQGIDKRAESSYTDPIIRARLGLAPLATR